MTTTRDLYLLFIRGDVEPELHAPFVSDAARDQEARQLRAERGDGQGIYPLDIANGMPEVGTYPGSFFEQLRLERSKWNGQDLHV